MFDPVNWNISKRSLSYHKADTIYVSFPKSGRTWVRVFIYAYCSFAEGKEFSWNLKNTTKFPKIVFTHDRYEHRVCGNFWQFIRGKFLVPPSVRHKKKIILMCRDPRDVIVSLYFQLSKREPELNMPMMSLKDMLRHEEYGIQQIVNIMNMWASYWKGKSNMFLIKYEDIRENPAPYFRQLLEFHGIKNIDEKAFAKALDYSSFENMKKREAEGKTEVKELKPSIQNDPESFKTRKGKVGGFIDYMDADDLTYCNEVLAQLDTMYGYKASS